MRILWLSPWFRPTARIHAESLRALGAEVQLYTADLHPESDEARDYETVLLGRPIPTAGWREAADAYAKARRFRPDVVVTELLRDPRWRTFAALAPRVRLVHDARPHDSTHEAPWWNRMFFDRWDARADATIVFSDHVADSLTATGAVGVRPYVAPLVSDLDGALAPDFVPADQRRDFVLFGRQKPYKNHAVVFAAWERHTRGPNWQGDDLVLLGDGDVPEPLPPHTQWIRGDYEYRDVVGRLARAKGSLVHSRSASQSGVAVLSMQLGVPVLASTAGGLQEYQPAGASVTGIDDVDGLSRAMDALADPAEVDVQARAAAEHHRKRCDAPVVAARLLEIFEDVVHPVGRGNA
jgi:glycosyltransferase involved in cell wall biosynthesis